MQKRKVLSLEWKSEGVMDNESGELMELMEGVNQKKIIILIILINLFDF